MVISEISMISMIHKVGVFEDSKHFHILTSSSPIPNIEQQTTFIFPASICRKVTQHPIGSKEFAPKLVQF